MKQLPSSAIQLRVTVLSSASKCQVWKNELEAPAEDMTIGRPVEQVPVFLPDGYDIEKETPERVVCFLQNLYVSIGNIIQLGCTEDHKVKNTIQ